MTVEKSYHLELVHDKVVSIAEGQSILEASLAAGIAHYHACGGNARCSTCRVLVIEGAELLTAPNEREQTLKRKMQFPPNVRLACQTRVTSEPVRVQRIIHDQTDIDLYVGAEAGTATQEIGEERDLAPFFLDIRDFTPFVESHLPFDVIHILRRLFGIFRDEIERAGGRVIETAGDGLYAVFGLQGELKTAVESAVNAGERILERIQALNATYIHTHFNSRIEVGIGLHVGRAISGSVGLGVNNSQTVIGYPVNIASRLESATKQLNNSFIISRDAFNLLSHPPENAQTAMVNLKGISGMFEVYLMGKPYHQKKEP